MHSLISVVYVSCRTAVRPVTHRCAQLSAPIESLLHSLNHNRTIFFQACSSDILLVASYLSDATDAITLAVEDCGGTNDQCTKDIADIAEYLGNATSEISKAVTACAGPKTKVECEADIAEGSIDVAKAVKFLIQDAPFITGLVIAVDGGRSLNL